MSSLIRTDQNIMPEVGINKGYELYQIITDFGEPLEIFREGFQNSVDAGATKVFCKVYEYNKLKGNDLVIEIWDNGSGIEQNNIASFFDLANSTKTNDSWLPKGDTIGYKGHGAKIFFNSEKIQICSKTEKEYWAAELVNPLQQLEDKQTFSYSDIKEPNDMNIGLPDNFKTGFFVRIINPLPFRTQHTLFKLNHLNIRDYSKWYTVFGTISTLFDKEFKNRNIELFLHGLHVKNFYRQYADKNVLDPEPNFEMINNCLYECIPLGHHFPEQRYTDKKMRDYTKTVDSNRPYYDFYSKMIYCEEEYCSNNLSFNLVINVEGYETKRRYDPLLSRRGRPRNDITHTDSERYGLWACKNGIPIEKIDGWIEGGKGTYSYLQAFVDCNEFNLTANRGSIHNSDLEKIEIIKKKVNEIFSSKKVKDSLNERAEIEQFENQIKSIDEAEEDLKKRYKNAQRRKKINLSDGTTWFVPQKLKKGYSESETLILLVNIISKYPDLFNFKLLDYNTSKGIDCVIEYQHSPYFVELKGTMQKDVNHPLRYIHKFICYDINFDEFDTIEDIEKIKATLKVNKSDKFRSYNTTFKEKKYTSYKLDPDSASVTSMEIIRLKSFLKEILDADVED